MIQALLQEVKNQLSKVAIYDIEELIQKEYINLGTSYDMRPFVDIIDGCYHIKVCERRQVISEYKTSDKRIAAYIILENYTYRYLYDNIAFPIDRDAQIHEKQREYFKMFDAIYAQYFEKSVSSLNLDEIE